MHHDVAEAGDAAPVDVRMARLDLIGEQGRGLGEGLEASQHRGLVMTIVEEGLATVLLIPLEDLVDGVASVV